MRRRRDGRGGAALIVVLAVLALISGMVVSMVVGMRLDRRSSYYYLERQRALLLAQEGTAYGRAVIEAALPPTNTTWWASQPGRLTVLAVTNGNLASLTNVALSTGPGDTNQTGAFAPADLNPVDHLDNARTLDPMGGSLPLGWVYVRADGTLDTNQAAAALTNNPSPLVGRFAFWIDDEGTRVNLNTAWGAAGNTNAASHPSQVSLAVLPGLSQEVADALHRSATNRPFNTPAEAFSVDAGAAAALDSNRFDLTHYSHDSELTPWGTRKIVLTTQAANLSSPDQPFLDILGTPNADPGPIANVDPTKLLNTLSNIVAQLSRTNWPYTSGGQSLASKYYASAASARAWQLAVDIVDYVRSKESVNPIVQPIVGAPGDFNWATSPSSSSGLGFFGVSRRPMINEMGTVFQTTGTAGRYHIYFYCGMWVPTNSLIAGSALPDKFTGEIVPAEGGGPVTLSGANVVMGTPTVVGTNGGGYLYRVRFIASDFTNVPGALAPTNCYLRCALQYVGPTYPRNDCAPLYYSYPNTNSGVLVPITWGTSATLPAQTAQVSDPRVNKRPQDWTVAASRWSTLLPPVDQGVAPPQDHTAGGTGGGLYATLFLPAPKGSATNPTGLVASVGELGYVSTGVECATNAAYPAVPFRTFRFQPTPGATTNTVPDWALAEIFAVPVPTNGIPALVPHPDTVAGRINLNAALEPFPARQRTNGMAAAFAGLSIPAATISNIARPVFAANGVAYGGTNALVSVGELAEIAGVSDSGEASEETFRALSSAPVTTRGNVFTIYSLGEAVKQLPHGGLLVTGHKLTRTMVERYPTNVVNGGTTNTYGYFRTVSWRED